ncbi:hypothetical protein LZ554_008522 [Drepanopeziza brunnea f. sp. 'monogermtubi']|nr:hypothetical protein LZ554_008522 [Drepanopeziza brunnea f. sp. 'monogermtubi']
MDSTVSYEDSRKEVAKSNWYNMPLSALVDELEKIGGIYSPVVHTKAVLAKYLAANEIAKNGLWLDEQIESGAFSARDMVNLNKDGAYDLEIDVRLARILEIEQCKKAEESVKEGAKTGRKKKEKFEEGEFFGFGESSISDQKFYEIMEFEARKADAKRACEESGDEATEGEGEGEDDDDDDRETKKSRRDVRALELRPLGNRDSATKPSQD